MGLALIRVSHKEKKWFNNLIILPHFLENNKQVTI